MSVRIKSGRTIAATGVTRTVTTTRIGATGSVRHY
jgi:hypothetical protein